MDQPPFASLSGRWGALLLVISIATVGAVNSVANAQTFTPSGIRQAYGFNQLSETGSGQTIAIITAYNALGSAGQTNLDTDVNKFDQNFSLPSLAPTVVSQTGTSTLPAYQASWAKETTLDVEYAHAVAPGATIEVIEASSSSNADLFTAAAYAAGSGASVVSMSFSGAEGTSYDNVFNRAGVAFVASTGDSGSTVGSTTAVNYPASSPYVIAVGGTSLTVKSDGSYSAEAGWSGSGGGMSQTESEPAYQRAVQSSNMRTVPDVSYDADFNTGVAIVFGNATMPDGGTSAAAPQWAALIALVDQQRASESLPALSSTQVLSSLYAAYNTPAYRNLFNDITTGSNGDYTAGTGYDEVTGLGSPIANELVPYLVPEPNSATATFAAFAAIALFIRAPRRRHLIASR